MIQVVIVANEARDAIGRLEKMNLDLIQQLEIHSPVTEVKKDGD